VRRVIVTIANNRFDGDPPFSGVVEGDESVARPAGLAIEAAYEFRRNAAVREMVGAGFEGKPTVDPEVVLQKEKIAKSASELVTKDSDAVPR
jgi:hypothetical protein